MRRHPARPLYWTLLHRAVSFSLDHVLFWVAAIGFVAMLLVIGGCAAGRGDDGSIVVGFPVAKSIETANQALTAGINAAISGASGGWGSIAGVLLPSLLGIGGAAFAAHAKGKETGWDQAVGTAAQAAAVGLAPVKPQPIGPNGPSTPPVGGAVHVPIGDGHDPSPPPPPSATAFFNQPTAIKDP